MYVCMYVCSDVKRGQTFEAEGEANIPSPWIILQNTHNKPPK